MCFKVLFTREQKRLYPLIFSLSHEAVTETRKRTPKTITGPKVDRSADGTLWGAQRLSVYDHFLITMTP